METIIYDIYGTQNAPLVIGTSIDGETVILSLGDRTIATGKASLLTAILGEDGDTLERLRDTLAAVLDQAPDATERTWPTQWASMLAGTRFNVLENLRSFRAGIRFAVALVELASEERRR